MKKQKANVMIALPCQRLVFAKAVFSLVHALRKVDFDYDFLMSMACDIVSSRTELVKQAQNNKGTHILFVDYDMFFPPVGADLISPITKLLEADKDIIGAAYNFRKDPLQSTATPKEGEDTSKPFKCEVLGAGLMLIKMGVFEKVQAPWFNFGRDKDGRLVQGEDTYFCRKAIDAGYDIWADPNLGVKHIGEWEF